jgi:hypothetical protein
MGREIIFPSVFPEMFIVLKTVPKKVENINTIYILHAIAVLVEGRVKEFNFRKDCCILGCDAFKADELLV